MAATVTAIEGRSRTVGLGAEWDRAAALVWGASGVCERAMCTWEHTCARCYNHHQTAATCVLPLRAPLSAPQPGAGQQPLRRSQAVTVSSDWMEAGPGRVLVV